VHAALVKEEFTRANTGIREYLGYLDIYYLKYRGFEYNYKLQRRLINRLLGIDISH